ncbi:MAG: bifunctional DNA-formamidopyrimidine glycosylase/DNA-(apurinic or apyrimidinic site) lyase [Pyrinomonadaceae bacterium]
MPELPEVETVVRSLHQLIKGRRISDFSLYREKLIPKFAPDRFSELVVGKRIEQVTRRAKYILAALSNGWTIATHLRMSGTYQIMGTEHENPKFTHAEFHFSDGERLVFSDQRHFGYITLFQTDLLHSEPELAKLAPEPFSEEFSQDYLYNIVRSSKRQIKLLLLDQTKVCGVGNIYASEALFLSGIHPETPSNRISRARAKRLKENICNVFEEAISHGVNVAIDPLNLESRYFSGDYEGEWRVYDREGEPCGKCGRPIRRLMHGGRSSFYCATCQRRPKQV